MLRRTTLKYLIAASAAALLPRAISSPAYAAQTIELSINKFKFDPKEVKVKVGDTLLITNFDGAPHTATAKDKSWDTGKLKKGQSAEIEITADMGTDFFCRFHPNMQGFLKIDG